jgi:hypothetical protein
MQRLAQKHEHEKVHLVRANEALLFERDRRHEAEKRELQQGVVAKAITGKNKRTSAEKRRARQLLYQA